MLVISAITQASSAERRHRIGFKVSSVYCVENLDYYPDVKVELSATGKQSYGVTLASGVKVSLSVQPGFGQYLHELKVESGILSVTSRTTTRTEVSQVADRI